MDLVTVTNDKFIKSSINLLKSYQYYSYNSNIFVYWFGESIENLKSLEKFKNVNIIEVPKLIYYAHNPKAFFYKIYAIFDVTKKTKAFIYSDSTNCFISDATSIESDLIDGSLLLSYSHPLLTNQYWTTKNCFLSIDGIEGAEIMPQYWAGFQAYQCNESNLNFIKEMYELSFNEKVLLPDTEVKKPDGGLSKCIEHRQDQSILSLLIHKHDKHQKFNFLTSDKYGDWQTINIFDNMKTIDPSSKKRILMPRESKFGYYRFL